MENIKKIRVNSTHETMGEIPQNLFWISMGLYFLGLISIYFASLFVFNI